MSHSFTLIFLAAFALTLAFRLWLAERQIRHLDALELAGCADCRDVVFTALRLAARDVLEAA